MAAHDCESAPYYPIMLDLRGRKCVVVGGGEVAARKVRALLDCGAQVVVVSPQAGPAIGDLARQGAVEWVRRAYTDGDLDDARLVIAAAPPQVNDAVAREARRRGLPVNVVDDPERCDFIVPAVVRRGRVVIAFSTGGASPALARRLRETLETQIGPEFGELAELLGRLRAEVLAVGDKGRRRSIWQAILDSRALDLLREGRREEAEAEARRCISSAQD